MAGRPTLYTEDTNRLALEYIDSCEDQEIERGGDGQRTEYKLKVKLPTVEGLSLFLNVSRDSIYAWASTHPEFSDTLDKLKAKQAEKLMTEGLANNYNSTIAKLMLSSNHGMREKSDVTSNDESISNVNVTIKSDGNTGHTSE